MLRKILKYFLWFLLVLLIVLSVVLILLQMTWFRGIIADRVLSGINESMEGEIVIGEIEGNLYRTIDLRGVALTLDGDTVASVERVQIEYEPRGLLVSSLEISEIALSAPRLHLVESPESELNLLRALKSTDEAPDLDTVSQPFDWSIYVEQFSLMDGHATVQLDGEQRRILSGLTFHAKGEYEDGEADIEVDNLELETSNPNLRVETLRLNVSNNSERATADLSVETEQNSLETSVTYQYDVEKISFSLDTAPIALEELEEILGNPGFEWHPTLSAEGTYQNNQLEGFLKIRRGESGLDLTGHLLTDSESYSVMGTLSQFDPQPWTGSSDILSPLTGDFSLAGKGFTPEWVTSEVHLDSFSYGDLFIDDFSLDASLRSDSLTSTISATGPDGTALVDLSISDIQTKKDFALSGHVYNLDISGLGMVSTDIDAWVEVNGEYVGSDSMALHLATSSDGLMIDSVVVDTMNVEGTYRNGILSVQHLLVSSGGMNITGVGAVDTAGWMSSTFAGSVAHLDSLAPLVGVDTLGGSVIFTGSVVGYAHALNIESDVAADSLLVGDAVIGDLSLGLSGEVKQDSNFAASVSRLDINWNGQRWENPKSIRFEISDDRFEFQDASIEADGQSIRIDGFVKPGKGNDISLAISQVDLSPFFLLFHSTPIGGIFDLKAELTGSDDNPHLVGSMEVTRARYGGLSSATVHGSAELADSTLTWSLDLIGETENSLKSNGFIPLRFSRPDTASIVATDRPFEIRVSAGGLNLAKVQDLEKLGLDFQGIVDCDLVISGVGDDVDAAGHLSLVGGSLIYPPFGINYRNIRIEATGLNGRLNLDEMSLSAGGGSFAGSGVVIITMEDGLNIAPAVSIQVKDFQALDSKTHQANITGHVDITGGEKGDVLFDGELTVNRSRFYVPAILSVEKQRDSSPPLLVAAAVEVDSTFGMTIDTTLSRGPLLPNVRGTIRLKIPRGTWLRGPRTNVEMRGELELIKGDTSIVLLGYLAVEKGTYEFYGRRFDIREGRIDFEDRDEIDPTLFFEVEYSYRVNDVENILTMVIRGPSSNPQLEFFENKEPVTEADAISIMIFGRRADDLNYGQKTTVNDVGGALAADLAANMVNSQLSGIGSALGLDVVRVSGEDNWNKATLTAGKYITDDIYVAYERGISQTGSSSVLFESAMLEYYLMRFLFLRLTEATDKTSGVDLMLRFD